MISDHADCPQHDQKSGRAQETADDGIGHVADGAAQPGQAESPAEIEIVSSRAAA